jgi:hypothetical protein
MRFKPRGGFPSIILTDEAEPNEKTTDVRGFSTNNIVSINNIMESKKKENLFIAFGTEDEDGVNEYTIDGLVTEHPHEYKNIQYKNVPTNSMKISRAKLNRH